MEVLTRLYALKVSLEMMTIFMIISVIIIMTVLRVRWTLSTIVTGKKKQSVFLSVVRVAIKYLIFCAALILKVSL